MRTSDERGIALITTLMVMMLMAALMVGFTAVVVSDQRFRGIDRDRTQSFYAAHSGLEKMTLDLFNLFKVSVAPTTAQLNAILAVPPVIPGITYLSANGTSGYTLTAQAPSSGVITSPSSAYSGLMALKTIYDMDSTARTAVGAEVHLTRRLETVAIPVFQFGMFSDVDLSFSAADDFDFGGRVHTNGNLFLAQGSGSDLTLRDKVTAVKEIVRQKLSNGNSIDNSGSTGTVSMATTPNPATSAGFRALARTEGSVNLGLGPSPPVDLNDDWPGLSQTTYNSTIRNGSTGARRLDLPLVTTGGSNLDLVKRALVSENTTNPTLLAQRFYSKVSLRILMSDTLADFAGLPGLDTSIAAIPLENWNTNPPAGYTVNLTHPPIALSGGAGVSGNAETNGNNKVNDDINVKSLPAYLTAPVTFTLATVLITCTGIQSNSTKLTGCSNHAAIPQGTILTVAGGGGQSLSPAGTGLIGGYLKIEMQNQANVWRDVTLEFINYGVGAPNPNAAGVCPASKAIVWLERLRDGITSCSSITASDYWPNSLFDAREALQRDGNPGTANVSLGGVMYHVGLDIGNLSRWFMAAAPYDVGTNGSLANNDSGAGYSVYFSDRRNNRNSFDDETGEYGWEDFVNPLSSAGTPNGSLDLPGEDLNENGTLEVYGGVPNYNGIYNSVVAGSTAPLTTTARPTTQVAAPVAKANRPVLFRRALKLANAATLVSSGIRGLTIASENPAYVQGNWNATSATWTVAHAATSIIADAVTLLSENWDDNDSFNSPYNAGGRPRSADSFFRVAIIAGKGRIFPLPSGAGATFGTDGGAHSFLRFLEGDSAGGNNRITYRGSMVTFFYNRQAVGPFKCCGGVVYSVPDRVYSFDTDFLTPALLPPLTPVFRDINTLGFSEETRPGR